MKKYGKIIGELPSNKLTTISYKYKDNQAINNIFNNLTKDFIFLTKKYTLKNQKYNHIEKKRKWNIVKETINEIQNNNMNNTFENIKKKMKSADRIHIYKELDKRNMNLNNLRKYNEDERTTLQEIMKELQIYNINKQNVSINKEYNFNSEYEFKNYVNRNILNYNQRSCKINKDKIYKEFKENFNSLKENHISNKIKLPNWWDKIEYTFPKVDELNLDNDIEFKYITSHEFNNSLTSMNSNSAPGPDGINYGMIKNCLGYKILINKLLNTCLYYNIIPDSFNDSITKLIDKNKDTADSISNWRPICLQNSTSKIFTKWISNKIYQIDNKLKFLGKPMFSDEQQGFKYDTYGCENHNSVLRSIYEDRKRNTSSDTHQLTTMMIDFQDAFSNLHHNLIHRMLNIFRIPEILKNIILQFYMKAKTRININKQEYTKNIYLKKGVRQGDPLSPILFNICIEPLIRIIKESKAGYKFKGNPNLMISIMAYADDILITTNTLEEMNIQFKVLGDFCNWTGININVNKCGCSSSFQLSNGEIGQNITNYIINEKPVPDIGYDGQMKYLGCYMSNKYRDIINSNDNKLYLIKENILSLNKSILSGTDKIKALKQYILPKMEYIIRNSYFDIKELMEIDTLITNCIKIWLKLPKSITNDIIYLKWFDGGLGVQNISERYRISKLVSFINLFNNETIIGEITRYTILEYEKNRKILKGIGERTFLDWKIINNSINSTPNRTQSTSMISKIYNTCSKYKIGLEYASDTQKVRIQIPKYIKTQINNYNILNQILRHERIQRFSEKKFQSYKSNIMINNKEDNKILKNILKMNDNLLRNLIIARTNTFATKYNTNIWNKNCNNNIYCAMKGCDNKVHNISHILQSCTTKRPIYRNRHNNISNLICQQLKRQYKYEIHEDQNQYSILEGNGKEDIMKQRPDIVLINRDKRNVIILEIAFINYINQFNNMVNEITEFKKDKYKELKQLYMDNGYTVNIYPLIFDSTGFIFKNTKDTLSELFRLLQIKISVNRLYDKINSDIIWNLSRLLNMERKILNFE